MLEQLQKWKHGLGVQYIPQRFGLTVLDENPGTVTAQVKDSRGQTELTLGIAGIDVTSNSGSLLSSSESEEGSAAAIRCFGNSLKVRVTRNPRMNIH